jgi:hypothetical protein
MAGIGMTPALDVAQSQEIAKQIKSKAKQPFDNAHKAVQAINDAAYVQGFLVFKGPGAKPVEHAWLQSGEAIIDPTFALLNCAAADTFYFPAQQISAAQLQALIDEAQEDYPEDDPLPIYGSMPYDYYGDVMMGGPEYTAAFEAAQAKCRELNPIKKPTRKGKPVGE